MKSGLEVDPTDELNDAPARIVGRRDVAVSEPYSAEVAVSNTSRRAGRRASDRRRGIGRILDTEVDVVEGGQELGAELEVDLLRNLGPLDQAQVKSGEARPIEYQIGKAALTCISLDAVGAVGRRDVAPSRRAKAAVTGRACCSHAEGFNRVVNDVLREEVGDLGRIIKAHLDRLLEILGRHPDQPEAGQSVRERIARSVGLEAVEDDRGAALKSGAALERPAFDRLADDASGIAQKPLAFAERQVVNPVGLESMVDNQRAERLEIRRTNRRVREGEAAGIDVTALDQ